MELFIYQPTLVTTERPMASIINGLGGYDCDFLEPPPDALLCLICTFVAREPMQMDCCGRVYCNECLTENKKYSSQCPQCRKDGNGFIDRKSEREINALKVKCENTKNGCEWTGELASLHNHLTKCDHALLPCPNECKENIEICQLLRKDFENHINHECPNRLFKCPQCNEEGKYHDITTLHLATCKIPCRNQGCEENIPFNALANHMKECPFKMVRCKYIRIGCEQKVIRKEITEHENDYQSHFHHAMETILKQGEILTHITTAHGILKFKMGKFNELKLSQKEASKVHHSTPNEEDIRCI